MEDWLLKRGYNSRLVREQILKARKHTRVDLLHNVSQPKSDKKLIFNITYHPALSKVKNILKRVHLLLTPDREHQKVFSKIPIVGFRRAKSLKDHLVRAKISTINETLGCGKCGHCRCNVCNYIKESNTFSDKTGSRKYDIRKGLLNCNSTNVIYLLQCETCSSQYVGSTITKFRYRFNNYKSKHAKYREQYFNGTLDPNDAIQQASFHNHFCQGNHVGLNDWSITLIDQANTEESLRRQESFWQYKLKTFFPDGLNERAVPLVVTQ